MSMNRASIFTALPNSPFTEDPVVQLSCNPPLLPSPLDQDFAALAADFDNLADDQWLKSAYVFRQRRFGRFMVDLTDDRTEPLEDEPFFQTTDVNRYAGGVERRFESLEKRTRENAFLAALMHSVLNLLPAEQRARSTRWELGVHLMRIIARPGQPGYPAPEGIHQDGHAFTSLTLMRRTDVDGAVSKFATPDGEIYRELSMSVPGDTVVFQDPRCKHDVTPIEIQQGASVGVRDICGFSLNPSDA